MKDKEIRDSIKRRTIAPSERLWDSLEHQLDLEKASHRKKYWWIGIAASFLIGVIITFLLHPQNNGQDKDVQLAQQEASSPKINKTVQKVHSSKNEISRLAKNTTKEESKKSESKESYSPTIKVQQAKINSPLLSQNTAEEKNTLEQNQLQNVPSIQEKKSFRKKIENRKNLAIAPPTTSFDQATVAKSKTQNNEVDRLLKKAQNRIQYMEIMQQSQNKIDPQRLLHSLKEDKSDNKNSLKDILRQKVIHITKTNIVAEK